MIQKTATAPILLTGYQALNELMGRAVYTSNQQIGGTKVMGANGVSHETVLSDLEGVLAALRWLSFVPAVAGGPLPLLDPRVAGCDALERPVEAAPARVGPFDPRRLVTGYFDTAAAPAAAAAAAAVPTFPPPPQHPQPQPPQPQQRWLSGLFDRDSWTECLAGWARSVVTGRARLGGIPVGVVFPETRSVERLEPADPADPASGERTVQQAGQVRLPARLGVRALPLPRPRPLPLPLPLPKTITLP